MSTEIAEFKQSEAALVLLKERYAVIPDFTTKEGYEEGRQGISELRTLRTGVDRARKRLNLGDQARIKYRNSEAKRITVELTALEDPLKVAKGEFDMIAEREAEAIRKKEEDRVGFIEAQIKRLQNGMNAHAGMELSHLEIMMNDLGDIFSAVNWEEFVEAADGVRTSVQNHIEKMVKLRVDFDNEQASLAVEREALEKKKEEQRVIQEEAERKIQDQADALAKEQAKAKKEMAEQQRKIDEERQDAARVMKEAQDKAKAIKDEEAAKKLADEQEQDRIEEAEAEKERLRLENELREKRLDAMRPDKQKAHDWISHLRHIDCGIEFDNLEIRVLIADVLSDLGDLSTKYMSKLEEL